jgi:micrococcal nuclease
MKRYLFIFLLLISQAHAAEYPARVVGITDGDTLTVLTAEKRQVKIRLAGIDAPESGQDFGMRAKQAASALAFGKNVTVIERDTDRYGRTVADIFLPDGRSLNRAMVGQGMAWWYRKYTPNDRVLAGLETQSRQERRGLWSQPAPLPPWDWRKGQGRPTAVGVIGNRRSHVYHLAHCPAPVGMKEANRVLFATAADAQAAGYGLAGDWRVDSNGD